MLQGYEIKRNNLTEQLTGDMLFENTFSDYELYQILESCKYKTTEKNLKLLKEGLASGKYYIEDQLDSLLIQEFKEYLNEDPLILTEDILNEGKILNKIRWKLALFSLRFLTETSINAFFIAYYADKKTGEATEKGKEFCRKSKKEKLAKMRELANGMKEEDKQKVINSQAAKQAERSGIFSLIGAGIAGAGAGVAAHTANMANNAGRKRIDINDTDVKLNVDGRQSEFMGVQGHAKEENMGKFSVIHTKGMPHEMTVGNGSVAQWGSNNNGFGGTTTGQGSVKANYGNATEITYSGPNGLAKSIIANDVNVSAGAKIGQETANTFNLMSGTLASIAGILFGAMWAGIIVAGVSTVKGVLSLHKANTLRRDEIISELKGKMDPVKAKELAKQYKQEFKQEKANKKQEKKNKH